MRSRSLSLATAVAVALVLAWGAAAPAADELPPHADGQAVDAAPLEDAVRAPGDDAMDDAGSDDSPDAERAEGSPHSDEMELDDAGLDLDALTAETGEAGAATDGQSGQAAAGTSQPGSESPAAGTGQAGSEAPVAETGQAGSEAPVAETGQAASEVSATGSGDAGDGVAAADADGVPAPGARGAATAAAPVSKGIPLGPIGYDEDGRKGRIHTVAPGNTLWAIADAYLGTPWVWPSIWKENERIENPHLIVPGDLIWITSSEMRRVTPEEARDLIAADPPSASDAIALDDADLEAFPAEVPETVEVAMPMALDQVPVSVPTARGHDASTGRSIHVASRESMSFVTSETLAAASSVVASPSPRVFLAEGDRAFVGLGEGEVEKGDQFTIFRDAEEVRDVDGTLLGYHVEILGWLQVDEVHSESALSTIRHSVAEMEVGDRLVPRIVVDPNVAIRQAPEGIEGHIVYMPDHRTVMGTIDYVYVNLGSIHGMEVGTPLEVFSEGAVRPDRVRRTDVQTPDRAVADLVVVAVKPDSAVAFVAHTTRELSVGDVIRTGTARIASRD